MKKTETISFEACNSYNGIISIDSGSWQCIVNCVNQQCVTPIAIKPITVLTPSGCTNLNGISNNGNCYIGYNSPAPMNWSATEAYCEGVGGVLPMIRSGSDNTAVNNVGLTLNSTYPVLWLGIKRTDNLTHTQAILNASWHFIDGSNGGAFNYSNWNAGEPSDSGNIEACLEMYGPGAAAFGGTRPQGTWNDNTCAGTAWPIVCQYSIQSKPFCCLFGLDLV